MNQYSPSISIDKENKFIITWTEWLNNSWAILGQRYLSDGIKHGEIFLIAETKVISERNSLVNPAVKLSNNKIITTWADTRTGETAYDIWTNIINWDDIVNIKNDQQININGDFELFQNYPNPFNPSTIIRYSVPSYEHSSISAKNATLKIYDILGKELAVLVDELKQPGTYEVNFDGKKLSSGVYYYGIKVGNYSDIKKMILVK